MASLVWVIGGKGEEDAGEKGGRRWGRFSLWRSRGSGRSWASGSRIMHEEKRSGLGMTGGLHLS
jgi:hypothetical protein